MIKMTNDNGSDFIHHYMSKPEMPLKNKRTNMLNWLFWFIFFLSLLIIGASCKKKNTEPTKQSSVVVQPDPKGLMDGMYEWYGGDSMTVDLMLITYLLNFDDISCLCNRDFYYSNLDMAKVDQVYYKCVAGFKTDTLIFGWHSKVFKYKRK